MSYARFGWDGSDVYVYMHSHGFLECCGCLLKPEVWEYHSTQDIAAHLRAHIAAGHGVPDDVIPSLERDDAENFPVRGGDTSP